jgi:hypothetical protein
VNGGQASRMPTVTAINSSASTMASADSLTVLDGWDTHCVGGISDSPGRGGCRAQLMKGMSCAGMMTIGRIMSRSSCSRMWQWYI